MSEWMTQLCERIAKDFAAKGARPMPRVVALEALSNRRLLVRFADRVQGVYDAAPLLKEPAFHALRDPDVFAESSLGQTTAPSRTQDPLCEDVRGLSDEQKFRRLKREIEASERRIAEGRVTLLEDMPSYQRYKALLAKAPARRSKPMPSIVEITARAKHRLFVRFDDGVQGLYDVTPLLNVPVFRPLRDPKLFAQVKLGETGAPTWPNEADLAPDGLYEEFRRRGRKRAIRAPKLSAGAERTGTRQTTAVRAGAPAKGTAKGSGSGSECERSLSPSSSAQSIEAQMGAVFGSKSATDGDRELAVRFPLALAELQLPPDNVRTPLGQRGVECGPGWRPLLVRLLERLESEIARMKPDERAGTRISQIKEKFGGLRVYVHGAVTPTMERAISAAVDEAANTCELCGASGRMASGKNGVWATRCEEHALDRNHDK